MKYSVKRIIEEHDDFEVNNCECGFVPNVVEKPYDYAGWLFSIKCPNCNRSSSFCGELIHGFYDNMDDDYAKRKNMERVKIISRWNALNRNKINEVQR